MKSNEKVQEKKQEKKQEKTPYTQVMKVCGMEESEIRSDVADLIKKLKKPSLEILPKDGEVHIWLTADTTDEKEGKKSLKPIVRELKRRFGDSIYSTDADKTLEMTVVELLAAEHLTLALAESCTGGMVASRIVNVPGASNVFREGFVTYTDKAKHDRLQVKKSTLKTESAVSVKAAKEMAKGGCHVSGADVCVSVTGYAGPDGGTKDKPVGTVFIGCCMGKQTYVRKYQISGKRERVRILAASYALALLRECLLGNIKG